MPRRRIDAAVVVFALLILATVAAFAYAQRLKRDPLVVDRVQIGTPPARTFTPNSRHVLPIEFRTTTSNDATVQVLREPGGEVVKTLVHGHFLKRYTCHLLRWNGSEDGGGTAEPGHYRVRVILENEDRNLTLPGTIRLRHAALPPPDASSRRFFKIATGGKCMRSSS